MAYRDRALVIDSLGSNWTATHAPAAGATCNATVSPAAKTRATLTSLGWNIQNGKNAAAYTATLSVRHASIAGTVIGSWDIIAAAAASLQDNWTVNHKGKKGVPLSVDLNPPNASVNMKVSLAGWLDTLSDG